MTWEFTRLIVLNHDQEMLCVFGKRDLDESWHAGSSYVGQITSANLTKCQKTHDMSAPVPTYSA